MVVARRLTLLVVFVGLLWVGWQFAHANAAPVDVDLLVARFHDVSVWLVLLSSFTLGGLMVGCFVMLEVVRSGLRTRRYRKTVSRLESEIHQLRNLPLAGADTPTPGVTAGDALAGRHEAPSPS